MIRRLAPLGTAALLLLTLAPLVQAQPAEPAGTPEAADPSASAPEPAAPGPAMLAKARAEIEAVQFDKAIAALDAALQSGQAERAHLVEIYRLIGETAVAMNQNQRAREAFRALLVLDPGAQLGELVSPKIKEELERARTELAGASLVIEHEQSKTGRVVVKVASDPAALVARAQLSYRRDDGSTARVDVPIADGKADVDLPPQAYQQIRIAILDGAGNRLQAIDFPDRPRPKPEPETQSVVALETAPLGATPVWQKWWLWAGVSGAFAATGVAFGLASSRAQSDLDAILDNPGEHFLSEAKAVESRARSRATWANTSYAVAGISAIVAGVFFWRAQGEGEGAVVKPQASAEGASVSLEVKF